MFKTPASAKAHDSKVAVPPPLLPPLLYLLILVLGHVGLELEVGTELVGAELAQVGAIDEDHLLGLQLVPSPAGAVGKAWGCGALDRVWPNPVEKAREESH